MTFDTSDRLRDPLLSFARIQAQMNNIERDFALAVAIIDIDGDFEFLEEEDSNAAYSIISRARELLGLFDGPFEDRAMIILLARLHAGEPLPQNLKSKVLEHHLGL